MCCLHLDKVFVNDDGLAITARFSEDRSKLDAFDWEFLSGQADYDPFTSAGVDLVFDGSRFCSTGRKPPEMAAFPLSSTVFKYL